MRRYVLVAVAAVFGFGAVQADEMSFPKRMPADIPGAPKLGAPFLVMAGAGPVLTGKHGLAAPALWDWNGDGRRDLLVGEFETNSSKFPMGADGSTVRVHLNVGTDSEPTFSEEFEWARDTGGAIMEVPQWCCIGFTPQFFDLNDDGYKDMITGQYHPGEVTWFRGSAEGFLPGQKLPQEGDPEADANPEIMALYARRDPSYQPYAGEPGDIGTFHYWVYTSATFGDLDDDGDYDLIVGGSEGLRVSENIGGRENPGFGVRTLLLDIKGQPLQTRSYTEREVQYMKTGGRLAPSGDGKPNPLAVDWDQDGVLDLLVTDSYRKPDSRAVSFFRGVKTPDGHRFEPGVDLLPAENGAKALPGSGQRVFVDDWNLDGVNDLIIGASVATVNGGEFSDELSWEWEAVNKVESAGKDPGRYAPRPRPTRESLSSFFNLDEMTEEEIEKSVQLNVRSWEDDVGRLYRENKGHWLTMRHQGRVYVMLGSTGASQQSGIAANTAGRASVTGSGTDSPKPGIPDQLFSPVSIRAESPVVLKSGGSADITVKLDMQDWYIYAPTGRNTSQGMKETDISFHFPDGIQPGGALKLPAYRFKGSYEIYSGAGVTWKQPIEAAPEAGPGDYEVTTEVTYQTCNDDMCLLPRTETIVTRVELR